MRNDDPGNALDGALDSALAQYSSVEPLAGLEQRVLDRVRAEGTARRIGFWRWVLAAGVAGTIAAGVWLERPVPHVVVAGKTGRPVIPASRQAGTPARLKSLKKRYGQARRAVPLSREERALVALVAIAPDQTREALLDLQRRSVEPIQMEEIKIEPLRSDDEKDDAK